MDADQDREIAAGGRVCLPPTAGLVSPARLGAAIGFAASVAVSLWGAGASAQTASQITPQSFRPPIETPAPAGLGVPAPEALAVPAGAEKLFVRLAGVDVEGAFPALREETRALEGRLTAGRISGAEIFAAARALESAYAAAGYVLARVVLPPQVLVDGGRLKLVVVDGTIEKIESDGVPETVRARIDAVVAPLVGRRSLTLGELERRLLLAGDTPGVVLRSALRAGAEPGTTILVLSARYRPLGAPVSIDNRLAASLGRWSLGLGLDLQSVAGQGELGYLRAYGDPNLGSNGFLDPYPRNRGLAAGIVLPIGFDGLTFNIEGTLARTAQAFISDITRADVFARLAFRVRYPWVRSRSLDVATDIAFDLADEQQSLVLPTVALPLARDRVRVLRLSGDAIWLTPWGGTLTGRVTASFGVDGLGARAIAKASALLPLSRQFADASFEKVEAGLSYAQPFADHLAVTLFARGQTSFGQALVQSEQIGIATPTGLSSFNAGTLQGDLGGALRAELSSPWTLPAPGLTFQVSPYGFGAIGAVRLQYPTILEPRQIRAASYGAGLRLAGIGPEGLPTASFGLEWGRQSESRGFQHGQRLMLVGGINF